MTLKQIPLAGGKGPTGNPGPGGKGWGWGYKSGWWYTAFGMRAGGGLVTADNVFVHPFLVGTTRTFDRMAFELGQQGSGNVRLGIYSSNIFSYPGGKLHEAPQITVAGVGVHEVATSVTLQQGLYWLAFHCSSVINVGAWECDASSPCLGMPGVPCIATGGGGFYGGYFAGRPYANGLPDPYPDNATGGRGLKPQVMLRAA